MNNFFAMKEHFTIKTTLSKDETLKRIKNRTKTIKLEGIRIIKEGKDNAAFLGKVHSDGFEFYNRKPFLTKRKGKFNNRDRVKIVGKISSIDCYTQIDLNIRPAYFLSSSNYSIYFFIFLSICILFQIFTDEQPVNALRIFAWLVMALPILILQNEVAKSHRRFSNKAKKMVESSFKNHLYNDEH